jgi:ABC-2 type transport system permease protein
MDKLFIVAKSEYLKTIRTKGFWISTLFLPIFMGVIMLISGYSGAQSETRFTKLDEDVKQVEILDESGLITDQILGDQSVLKRSFNLDESINNVKNGKSDALIHYSKDIVTDGKVYIYAKDQGDLFNQVNYTEFSRTLLNSSTLSLIPDERIRTIINKPLKNEVTLFNNKGEEVDSGYEKYILPAFFAAIFFFTVFSSSQYMLQSVAEEKENRMIEMILSMIKEETLIYGKILGLCGVVLTQIFTWILLGIGVTLVVTNIVDISMPISIDWSSLNWDIAPVGLYFILVGFLLFAAIMVGVGAVGTNYKDSQSLSTIFVLLSIFPIYFIMFIITDPDSILSRFLSYFPFTSPMILLVRSSIGSLNTFELILGILLNIVYVFIAFKLATILFNLGSLMYSRRPTWKEITYAVRR